MNTELRKRIITTHIWAIAFHGWRMRTITKQDKKKQELWMWGVIAGCNSELEVGWKHTGAHWQFFDNIEERWVAWSENNMRHGQGDQTSLWQQSLLYRQSRGLWMLCYSVLISGLIRADIIQQTSFLWKKKLNYYSKQYKFKFSGLFTMLIYYAYLQCLFTIE